MVPDRKKIPPVRPKGGFIEATVGQAPFQRGHISFDLSQDCGKTSVVDQAGTGGLLKGVTDFGLTVPEIDWDHDGPYFGQRKIQGDVS